jgi:PIN domain nuclease of toxin-antitoxin system
MRASACERVVTPTGVSSILKELNLGVVEELGVKQVHEIARLAPEAKRLGLSLGDCVCLTQAEWRHLVAVTAERRWPEIDGRKVKILLIR